MSAANARTMLSFRIHIEGFKVCDLEKTDENIQYTTQVQTNRVLSPQPQLMAFVRRWSCTIVT